MNKSGLFEIRIDAPSAEAYRKAKKKFDALAKPLDGFGDFEDIICNVAAMQQTDAPDISNKGLVVMIADNGVAGCGVSQTDPSVTLSVAKLLAKGESTVGKMTSGYPVGIFPVDVGIDTDETIPGIISRKVSKGTGNISKEAAMTEEQCLLAIGAGMETVKECRDKGIRIIATGEMGIGNTTTAAAMLSALTGKEPEIVTGRGAGLSDEGLARKIKVIEEAIELHGLGKDIPDREYAFSALCAVGGLDIAALSGVFIACAMNRIPCVIDGLISAVAAYTAQLIVSGCRDYMIASHKGRERGCQILLDLLGLKPVMDADMALGEGTGAVMIFPLLDMVMSVFNSGTSFSDAGIEQYERFDVC